MEHFLLFPVADSFRVQLRYLASIPRKSTPTWHVALLLLFLFFISTQFFFYFSVAFSLTTGMALSPFVESQILAQSRRSINAWRERTEQTSLPGGLTPQPGLSPQILILTKGGALRRVSTHLPSNPTSAISGVTSMWAISSPINAQFMWRQHLSSSPSLNMRRLLGPCSSDHHLHSEDHHDPGE